MLVCIPQLEDIFVTERLLWHNICNQGDTTHKTMTSHCIWTTVQLPNMRVIFPQAQLNKNVITKMVGEEKLPFHKTLGFFSYMLQKKNYKYIELLKNECHYVRTSLMKD